MGRVLVSFFWACVAPNDFVGTIFRTREYERWFVYFWECRLPNGFIGTIFRTCEYEGGLFFFWPISLKVCGYDFSYPWVWGGYLFPFLGLCCSQWFYGYDFSYPRVCGNVGEFGGGVRCRKNSGYEQSVPTIYKGILFSYNLTSWRRLPSWWINSSISCLRSGLGCLCPLA